ncbi:MAG: PhzF family phenazine biosynthesis protein [Burkholderiaceae bacterium]|jgi:PhzF family phenazine biosynthesis protein
MSMTHRFQLVDVFSEQPFSGNPLAVVFDADGLSTEQMQAITRWLNLSETAFLLTPDDPLADYRLRIFTLDRELPFAGHPTLGGCHAWLSGGGTPRHGQEIIQECGAGLIPIRRSASTLAFSAPPVLRSGPVDDAVLADMARFLRIDRAAIVDAQWADNGPGWLVLLLESAAAVLALEPQRDYPTRLDLGVVGPHPAGSDAAFELRAFLTDHHGAVREDPVTGSLNASTAQWLLATGRAKAPYFASQGGRLGRAGRIHLSVDAQGGVWVGGKTMTLFSGQGTF